ncbi:hypothetical protein [Bosea sp. (in: a-proteobacteria)]|uniref:hypothetical protein n=1 Tax=Bosea sp. (in: a-proteobacteria) TaxID=1871050 RepID=UPI002FCA888B
MIRFRTIDPAEAEKPAPQPAVAPPPARNPVAEIAAADGMPGTRPKGLTRKTPLRAKKPGPTPLLDE